MPEPVILRQSEHRYVKAERLDDCVALYIVDLMKPEASAARILTPSEAGILGDELQRLALNLDCQQPASGEPAAVAIPLGDGDHATDRGRLARSNERTTP